MKLESDVNLVQREMREMLAAIERYQDAKGSFPPSLEALVPTYVRDRGKLRFSQNSQGPAFKYTIPQSSGNEAILEYALAFKLPDARTIPVPLRLSRDGAFEALAIPDQCTRFMRAMQ